LGWAPDATLAEFHRSPPKIPQLKTPLAVSEIVRGGLSHAAEWTLNRLEVVNQSEKAHVDLRIEGIQLLEQRPPDRHVARPAATGRIFTLRYALGKYVIMRRAART
jgi:hypothetical protein